MRRLLISSLMFLASLFIHVTPSVATTIDFSDPAVVALMTNTYVGSHVMQYSNPLSVFSLLGATLTATGSVPPGYPSPSFLFRSTFDDRSPSPYSYDFIDANVAQIASTGLDIAFATPMLTFSFGAALNATASPSNMQVQLLGLGNSNLGIFNLLMNRTVLSVHGGTNSNSEGLFVAPSVGPITGVRLLNFGDGTSNGSQFNWVIDNITFQPAPVVPVAPVPEPTSALLLGTGLVAVVRALKRRADGR